MMGRTDSPLPPFCCSVFVFESFRVSGRQLTMAALVSIGIDSLCIYFFSFHVASFHGLWDHICGRYCIIILAQFDPYETNNAHESEVVCPRELCKELLQGLHLFRGIRLPIRVQGASTRVLSLSSSDMKATKIIIPDSVFGFGRWRWWKSFVSVFDDDGEDRLAVATILLFRVHLRIL
ncbi:hypothetical protein HanIR_Chr11g0544801 [Helianthus annuus]|nr:hypothetical protein HanIR_Chr11g0544801 [Helianthus annuus]